jgi:NAD(P)-dependent dehydrogenase (short-subunit alcohol dehydrogenase family)
MILVTGGAGFIGANFVLDWLAQSDEAVVNLDILSYAGNRQNLASLSGDDRHFFVQGDIGDSSLVSSLLTRHQPRAIINFAAESHVDRSTARKTSFKPTLSAPSACWKQHTATGTTCKAKTGKISASCMSLPMKFTAHSPRMIRHFRKPIATNRTALTRRAKPPATI